MNSFPVLHYTSWMGHCTVETKYFSVEHLPDELAAWLADKVLAFAEPKCSLTLILRRSRTGTVWFYTSTSNKNAARLKLYTKSLTRDLKRMYSRFTLVRISINLYAPRFFYIGTGVSLLFRERFLYIYNQQIYFII